MAKIPQGLQGVLWSRDIKNLNLSRDKEYIINQILAFGTIEHLRWLLKNYPRVTIVKVFLTKPIKIYSRPALNLIKLLFLGKRASSLNDNAYVEDLPRDIRTSTA